MRLIDRRRALAASAALFAAPAFAQMSEATKLEISDDALREALALPGTFRLGPRGGDVALIEFFDYNCPWCRQAARDLDALLKSDSRLKLILVNYAVLGVESALAAKVSLAVASEASESFAAFHRELMAQRGTVGGDEALAAARKLAIDVDAITETANSDVIAAALTAAAEFGARNGLTATPSWMIGRSAYVGHLPLQRLRAIVAAGRA